MKACEEGDHLLSAKLRLCWSTVSRPRRRAVVVLTILALLAGALAGVLLARRGADGSSPTRATRFPPPAHQLATLRALVPFRVRYRDLLRDHTELVRNHLIRYRANDGASRIAYVVLPRWYNPRRQIGRASCRERV